jgi:nucleotide-binding universal stress UspA family protein
LKIKRQVLQQSGAWFDTIDLSKPCHVCLRLRVLKDGCTEVPACKYRKERTVFKKILVPLDGSIAAESVLPHVVTFARTYGARIQLLRILSLGRTSLHPGPVDPLEWNQLKLEAEAYLEKVAERLKNFGFPVEQYVLEGEAGQGIVEFARSHGDDLIVLSRQGKGGLSVWNVNSVVHRVLQRSYRSLLILPARFDYRAKLANLRYQRLLVPLDGSQRAEWSLSLADQLARSQNAQVILAHVVKKEPIDPFTIPRQEDLELAEQLAEQRHQEANQYLGELQSRFSAGYFTVLETSENVSSALHRIAAMKQVDLVLLCAHGYSASSAWPYGSVTASFIQYFNRPVLILQDLPLRNLAAFTSDTGNIEIPKI